MNVTAHQEVYRVFFENSPHPAFTIDHQNNLTSLNQAGQLLYGFSENHAQNGAWFQLVDSKDLSLPQFWSDLQKKGSKQLRLTGVKKDGEQFSGVFSFNLIEKKESKAAICTISVEKQLQGNDLAFSEASTSTIPGNDENEDKLTIQKLTRIYDNLSEVIFMFDVENENAFRFESVNSSFLKVTGLQREQVVGRLVQEVIPEPSLTLVLSKYAQAIKTGEIVQWEEITPYPTGVKTGLVKVVPLYNDQHVCTKLLGSVTDITAVRVAEEQLRISNERYEYASKASNDALYDWNIATNDLHWGEGFEKLIGFNKEEIPTNIEFWYSLLHPEDKEEVIESLDSCLKDATQDQWGMEYRLRRADGSYAYVVEHGFILRDSQRNPVRMVGALNDISIQKQHEAEREMLIKHLMQRNADLEQFSFITSHNLRAPVSNLLGLVQLLEPETAVEPRGRYTVEQIKESTHQLNHIVNDLSEILVLKNNQEVVTQKVSIKNTFLEVSQSLKEQINQAEATVQTDFSGGDEITFSPDYLRSILLNLLTNSLQFRSPDRPLKVTLKTEQEEEDLKLSFADNGIGIDLKRYGHRIFLYQRFQAKQDNKGIGLFMIQEQLKAMGGSISVESDVDQGTTFIIRFSVPSGE